VFENRDGYAFVAVDKELLGAFDAVGAVFFRIGSAQFPVFGVFLAKPVYELFQVIQNSIGVQVHR
jgi:hypothetical protein